MLVSGKALYTVKASKTACSTSCLKIWPELVLPKGVTKATAGSGVECFEARTISRPGGVLQVTYGGKPLYFFVGDKSSGAVSGNLSDTWGAWSDVVTVKPTTRAKRRPPPLQAPAAWRFDAAGQGLGGRSVTRRSCTRTAGRRAGEHAGGGDSPSARPGVRVSTSRRARSSR